MSLSGCEGKFVVGLTCEGRAEAVLTGRHFMPEESIEAERFVAEENSCPCSKVAMFLADDSHVSFAASSCRRAVKSGMSGCVKGRRGKPCCKCPECLDAMADAFTRYMLGSVELPRCGLSERLKDAVSDVIGMTTVMPSWIRKMEQSDVDDLVEKMTEIKERK